MKIKDTDAYLRKLEEELIELPKKERKAIVAEIKDHFSNEIMEQMNQGKAKKRPNGMYFTNLNLPKTWQKHM